ncbi:MAG: outer membrane beta-barrel protein [Mucilaginibacter sp.]|nr:outer membrane beta-barrel protein [Mucilaginibacter sp.]
MKKVLLLLTVICGLTVAAKAQSKSETGKFSIGVEAGLPLGSFGDGYSFGIGGSLKYDQPIAEGTFVTGSAGYTSFIGKSVTIDGFGTFKNPAAGFVPVKVGVKYFLAESFYGEAQLGAAFSTQSGGGTAFAYSPGIGYAFSPNVDLGIRYEAWSNNGTVSQVAARLAYSF